MIAHGVKAEGRSFSPFKLEQMFADFIAHYSEHLADRSRPFPGLTDALDALSARGCQFAVCTNKLERLSVLLLDRLQLADRFVAICGQDTFGIQKPDPEILRRTVAAAGGQMRNAVMIGDSITYISTARSATVIARLPNSGRTGPLVILRNCQRLLPPFRPHVDGCGTKLWLMW